MDVDFGDDEVDDFAAPLAELSQTHAQSAPTSAKQRRVLIVVSSSVCILLVAILLVGLAYRSRGTVDTSTQHWDSLRLPAWQKPQSYDIHLKVHPVSATFSGKESIRVDLLEPSSFFVLHGLDLTVDGVSLVTPVGETLDSLPLKYYEQLQLYVVPFTHVFQAASGYTLHVEWHSVLDETMVGLYQSTYVDKSGRNETLASTHFEATDARRAFPCFDEPELKASFQLSVDAPKEYTTVLFNTPVKSSVDGLTTFESTPLMSTYLLAIVVSKFQSVASVHSTGLPVKTWARPEHSLSGQYSADITSLIVRAFNGYFGVDFALPKLDLVAVPDFNAGAMENWGLITFRETALLYDPRESGTSGQQRVALVTSHELAHQWFGDLVTMRWWRDVWLNEGFASFVEFQGVDAVHPDWHIWQSFIFTQQRALYADSLQSTHPVSTPAETPAEIGAQFGAIIYSKGGSLLRMLKEHLDHHHPDSFRIGLQHYLAEHKYNNAATEDLWSALSASSGVDVADMMSEWTQNPGYPVVSITPGWCLKQIRFFQKSQPPSTLTWMIPLRYRTVKKKHHFDQVQDASLVMPESLSASSCLDYDTAVHRLLVLNVNRTGFYRVRYSSDMVRRLVSDVNSSDTKQSVADVLGLLDDLYAFSKTDEYPVDIRDLFNLVDAAFAHPHLKSSNLYDGLIDVTSAIKRKVSSSIQLKINSYIARKIAPLITSLGWNVTENNHDENLTRELLMRAGVDVGRQPELASFQEEALRLFEVVKAGGRIHPDLRDAVYRASLLFPDDLDTAETNYQFLMDKYLNPSTAPIDAKRALRALPYSKRLIPKLLRDSLVVVRQQDTTSVISSAAAHDSEYAWRFIQGNFDLLRERFAHHLFTFSSLLRGVCSHLTSDADKVAQFLTSKNIDPKVVAGIKEVIQATEKWDEKYGSSTETWIRASLG